jgi:hypothetical protein
VVPKLTNELAARFVVQDMVVVLPLPLAVGPPVMARDAAVGVAETSADGLFISVGDVGYQQSQPIQCIKGFFEAAVLGGIDNLGEPIDGLVHGDIDHALL